MEAGCSWLRIPPGRQPIPRAGARRIGKRMVAFHLSCLVHRIKPTTGTTAREPAGKSNNNSKLMKSFAALSTVALTCAAALSAHAQEWAKPRLEKSPRHLDYVTVKNGNRTVNCFIAYPQVKEKATAVIVIHEIYGLSDWVKSLGDQLAEAGYIAIVPDLLSGMAPGGAGGTKEIGDRDAVTRAVRGLPAQQVTADLNAVAEYVSKLPACNGKIAVSGFCWGGGQSFRYATDNSSLKAAFVFYGDPPPADSMAKIKCPVYGFYGGKDARITQTVPKTEKEMKAAGKTYEPVVYEGAGHGFMRAGEDPTDNSPDNKKARAEAWTRWKNILQKL
jgi:carboxymethylenebutenolidase